MTTLQKTLLTATVAVLAGAGIYEARQAADARAELQTLQQHQSDQVQQIQRDAAETARQLAALRDDNERLNRNTGELLRLRSEIGGLRSQTQNVAELRTENAQLRNRLDKAGQAQQTPTKELESERRQQTTRAADILMRAALMYAAQNNGQLPKSIDEASRFFKEVQQAEPGLRGDDSKLAEQAKLFELVFQGSSEGITNAHNVILLRETAPRQRDDGMFERAYGFADGNVEGWITPDGKYSELEAKRPTYNDSNTRHRLQQAFPIKR